jgi:hypothetical protein
MLRRRHLVRFLMADGLLSVLFVSGVITHASPGTHAVAPMSASQLERRLELQGSRGSGRARARLPVRVSCSRDQNGGWDYICTSSNGEQNLYDVAGSSITARGLLPSVK